MLKKILIIAQSEAKANEGAKLLSDADSSLKVRKVYLGAKRVPRHFEAVVVYHTQTTEINFIKDEIQRYSEAPIKAFLAKAGAAYGDASSHKAKAFVASNIGDMLNYLR